MEVKENEMLFIYDTDDPWGKEALGYAKSLKSYVIKEMDINKDFLTESQLAELAQKLKVTPGDLISDGSGEHDPGSLSQEDILKLLVNKPKLMITPVAVYHDSAQFVKSPYSFIKKDMKVPGIKSKLANADEKNN